MNYNIQTTSWKKDKTALSEIRRKVFIEEQKVPESLEWDEFDEQSTHVLVTNIDNTPIACGRLKKDGQIGRMAVLKAYRQSGIGSDILKKLLISANNKNIVNIYLHAQITAISFYEKQGFEVSSDEFMDAGIPHKSMSLNLTSKLI